MSLQEQKLEDRLQAEPDSPASKSTSPSHIQQLAGVRRAARLTSQSSDDNPAPNAPANDRLSSLFTGLNFIPLSRDSSMGAPTPPATPAMQHQNASSQLSRSLFEGMMLNQNTSTINNNNNPKLSITTPHSTPLAKTNTTQSPFQFVAPTIIVPKSLERSFEFGTPPKKTSMTPFPSPAVPSLATNINFEVSFKEEIDTAQSPRSAFEKLYQTAQDKQRDAQQNAQAHLLNQQLKLLQFQQQQQQQLESPSTPTNTTTRLVSTPKQPPSSPALPLTIDLKVPTYISSGTMIGSPKTIPNSMSPKSSFGTLSDLATMEGAKVEDMFAKLNQRLSGNGNSRTKRTIDVARSEPAYQIQEPFADLGAVSPIAVKQVTLTKQCAVASCGTERASRGYCAKHVKANQEAANDINSASSSWGADPATLRFSSDEDNMFLMDPQISPSKFAVSQNLNGSAATTRTPMPTPVNTPAGSFSFIGTSPSKPLFRTSLDFP